MMNKQDKIIDFILDEMNEKAKRDMKKEIGKNPMLQKEHEDFMEILETMDNAKPKTVYPSDELRIKFYQALKNAENSEKKSAFLTILQSNIRPIISIAAIGLTLLTVLFVFKNEVFQINLKEDQMVLKEMDAYLNSPNVSTRIKAVNYSNQISEMNEIVLDILFGTAEEDKNANVRLAAVEALGKYTKYENVIESLGHLLQKESDPVVKIAIINIISQDPNEIAQSRLEEIIENEMNPKFIIDEAHSGLNRVSKRIIY